MATLSLPALREFYSEKKVKSDSAMLLWTEIEVAKRLSRTWNTVEDENREKCINNSTVPPRGYVRKKTRKLERLNG